jgi:peptidoglycan/LPS O-acetylase OafA/YrhL
MACRWARLSFCTNPDAAFVGVRQLLRAAYTRTMGTLPNLDFLRACAVVSVVAEHILLAYGVQRIGYVQVQWVGVVGVFLFFVHTALVLMSSLERSQHVGRFYVRRIFRIYPLATVATFAILVFHAPVAGSPKAYFHYSAVPNVQALTGALLLIPNIVGGWLPSSVMWTLPYEMEMYLALPLLFFVARWTRSVLPLVSLWVLTILTCAVMFPGTPHNFFLCVPYFLPGVIAYVLFGMSRPKLPSWSLPIGLFVVWALFLVSPGWRLADLLCLAVGFGLPAFEQIKSKRLIITTQAIAKYSYGLYLAHPFAIVLGIYLMPHKPIALQLAVMLGASAVLAVSAYHLVEAPMIRWGTNLAERIPSAKVADTALCAVDC